MPSFAVVDAKIARQLPAKDNWPAKNVVHLTLSANGTDYLVTDFYKQDESLPATGATIEGELGEQDKFDSGRRKFQRPRRGGFGGGGSRKRDPAESRRIERQHAQHMALQYIGAKVALGKIEDFDFTDVQKLASAFDRDLEPPASASDFPGDDGGLPPTGTL